MKTKLYVAALGGGLLFCASILPSLLFSSDPYTVTGQEKEFLNYNSQANIPGLDIKTPAKTALVNKRAIAALNRAKQAELLAKKEARSKKNLTADTCSPEKSKLPALVQNLINDVNQSLSLEKAESSQVLQASTGSIASESVLPEQKSGRTVVNYEDNGIVLNTANVSSTAAEKILQSNLGAEIASLKEETIAGEIYSEAESTTAFRGKLAVKSALVKFIPSAWDGFSQEMGDESVNLEELMRKAFQLGQRAKREGYNTEYAFMADMGVKSNKNRFFVVNLKTMQIEKSCLVTQGRGTERLNLDKEYSNEPGSNLSSLGIYKIGNSYEGIFGHSYHLNGLESSNNKALQRDIVLHSMGAIPELETNFPINQSEGCPAVSPKVLETLGNIIDNSSKPILLWMFDDNYLPMN